MNVNNDSLEEIKTTLSKALNPEDIKKYALTGENFYNMMNFEQMENPTIEHMLYVTKLLNTSNNSTPKDI